MLIWSVLVSLNLDKNNFPFTVFATEDSGCAVDVSLEMQKCHLKILMNSY